MFFYQYHSHSVPTDFGLSIDMKEERPVTRAGTLDYMAPEVLACPDKKSPEENKNNLSLVYSKQVMRIGNEIPKTFL